MPNDSEDPPPVPNGTVPLRDYVEAIFNEFRRAVRVASEEREKAAQALRTDLSRAIEDGDRALRDHIEAQVSQIRSALKSAELLEVERIKSIDERLAALQREATVIHEASERAIAKAEAATEKRFESVNEWRDQSADRERSYQEQAAAQTAEFPRREVVEAQLNELKTKVDELTRRMDKTLS